MANQSQKYAGSDVVRTAYHTASDTITVDQPQMMKGATFDVQTRFAKRAGNQIDALCGCHL